MPAMIQSLLLILPVHFIVLFPGHYLQATHAGVETRPFFTYRGVPKDRE